MFAEFQFWFLNDLNCSCILGACWICLKVFPLNKDFPLEKYNCIPGILITNTKTSKKTFKISDKP